ncbi:MAG: insulinase family protein [Bacteroidia bacterium]|nr:insulinase family protein [Bacteroidia bacterium]MDW8235937.1 hypothetical protein [Bacteroidia bacterium]
MSFRVKLQVPPLPSSLQEGKLNIYWQRTKGSLSRWIAVWDAPALHSYPAGLRRLLLRLIQEENPTISRRLCELGWDWSWEARQDYIVLYAEGLTENLTQAIDTLHAAITHPVPGWLIAQKHLQRMIEARVRAWASPPYRADAILARNLWGSTYTVSEAATPEMLRMMDISLLAEYQERFLLRGLRALWIAAPVLPSVSRWASLAQSISYELKIPLDPPAANYAEPASEAKQTSLRLAYPWFRLAHPAYGLYRLALVRLGGYFGSMLMRSIREEAGLTYGIYARAVHTWVGSYFVISTEVARSRAEEALQKIHAVVKEWSTCLFPEPSILAEVRNYTLLHLMPETLGEWLTKLAHWVAAGQTLDAYLRYLQAIDHAAWKDEFATYFPTSPNVQVVVGGPEVILSVAECV